MKDKKKSEKKVILPSDENKIIIIINTNYHPLLGKRKTENSETVCT